MNWGAIGGAVLSSAADLLGGSQQNKWNREAAQKQMDFQERMSSTAHQREVEDLKAAGLNPILSANSGASSPSGASYSAQNIMEGVAANAKELPTMMAQIKNLNQSTNESITRQELNKTQKEKTELEKSVVANQSVVTGLEALKAAQETNIRKTWPNQSAYSLALSNHGLFDLAGKGIGTIIGTGKQLKDWGQEKAGELYDALLSNIKPRKR